MRLMNIEKKERDDVGFHGVDIPFSSYIRIYISVAS